MRGMSSQNQESPGDTANTNGLSSRGSHIIVTFWPILKARITVSQMTSRPFTPLSDSCLIEEKNWRESYKDCIVRKCFFDKLADPTSSAAAGAPSLTLRSSPGQGIHVHIQRAKRDHVKLNASPLFVNIFETRSTKCYFYEVKSGPLHRTSYISSTLYSLLSRNGPYLEIRFSMLPWRYLRLRRKLLKLFEVKYVAFVYLTE